MIADDPAGVHHCRQSVHHCRRLLCSIGRRLTPDAVLADMQLAELDGGETTRLLLAQQPDLVTILLAFAWEPDTLERARRSGARAWLAKDCAEAALFAAMRSGQFAEQEDALLAGVQNAAH